MYTGCISTRYITVLVSCCCISALVPVEDRHGFVALSFLVFRKVHTLRTACLSPKHWTIALTMHSGVPEGSPNLKDWMDMDIPIHVPCFSVHLALCYLHRSAMWTVVGCIQYSCGSSSCPLLLYGTHKCSWYSIHQAHCQKVHTKFLY